MEHIPGQVEVWEESVVIPTYGVGKPDPNPMFLEKRVYQGSSGKVYPLPVIDKIYDEKIDQTYRAVWLENDYLRVMILPELGGRVQRAYDKTNGYDFVYYNEVIKPALVGLVGPWISGGIEFNWPQHHRPSTFMPVDHTIEENPDGSKTVRVSEVDRMYGTKSMASFTRHPGRAYLEIKGQLYNPTSLPQTFLWWANPAVAVNDNTQSIFPPDVHAVMDHGKRAVSRFPIATGTYYKYDYGAGVDISRYKNIPVPTSYMAYHSDYNFVGGYDYGVEAGVLHIADHHVSPGKKQWTWGCGDFGQAWDRNLTDEMARRVAEAGGIIGVAAVPNFLDASLSYGENCTRAAYLKHIAHLSDVVGTEHVAIGTDFFGAGYFPEGMSDYSDFPALAADMEKTGFGRQDIENIFYGNAERFFRIRQGAENE